MLIEGTKIRLMKEIQGFEMLKIGDIFVITSVGNNGAIHFKTNYGMGFMNYSELKKYFEVVIDIKKKEHIWSEWKTATVLGTNKTCKYRTNGKKVEVRIGDFKASATCHDSDEFEFNKGIKLCLARIEVKKAEHKLNLLLDEINNK
ncbi:TPA: hypothetical protein P5O16_001349 [Clostridioides difficile]|uniref:hypothetical protein n=1 Tax=Clostridioides difficile TaxID=1496 RepID=UPI00097FDD4B|nr:hypothetical protein [Clostridioides difficile]SJS83781.1 Uncharacterised protein [Clostridioides difficile]HBF5723191.1 hypothetical protein [Clostridioides difficile]HBG8839951.1 hypothetical protein [Clostridioides difficile]HBG8865183.1 hypothetical protein [Clostridioides difficile]HBG8932140.1 hypothetical protein [Clostridioides difficile]